MKQAILKAIFGVVLDIMHVVKVLLLDNITRFRRMLTLGGTQGEMSAFYAGKTVLITGASSGLGQGT
jgi:NADPH:quinone reductase-like Zn-dependent oxidoreductase